MTDGGTIHDSRGCRRCGYNLQGLAEAGRCPECGMPIVLGGTSTLLRFADSGYLTKLHWGGWLFVLSFTVDTLNDVHARLLPALINWNVPLGQVIQAIVWIPCIAAGWLISAPNPSGVEPNGKLRSVVRWMTVVDLIDLIVTVGVPNPQSQTTNLVVWMIEYLADLAFWIAAFFYVAALCGRIPSPRRAKWICAATIVFAGVELARLASDLSVFWSVQPLWMRLEDPSSYADWIVRGALLFLIWRFPLSLHRQVMIARKIDKDLPSQT